MAAAAKTMISIKNLFFAVSCSIRLRNKPIRTRNIKYLKLGYQIKTS